MEFIKKIREKNKQTQRGLAEVSGVAFGTIQLVEKGENVRLKTLGKIAEGLGYQVHELKEHVDFFFREAPASVFHVAKQMSGNKDWKIHFFNFVSFFIILTCGYLGIDIVYGGDTMITQMASARLCRKAEEKQ